MYAEIRIVLLWLVAVAVLASVARRIKIPYPIALVLGGLAHLPSYPACHARCNSTRILSFCCSYLL